MASGRAILGADNEALGQRAADQKRQRTESSWACQYKYIYLYLRQAFSMKNHLLSAAQIAALRKRFQSCKTQILALDWVTQGSSEAKAHRATGAGPEKSKPRP